MSFFRGLSAAIIAALFATTLGPAAAPAQDAKGKIRIQNQDFESQKPAALPHMPEPVDYREEMRRFVEKIAAFARSHDPNFIVVAEGGLALLEKASESDPDHPRLSRKYVRAIDGVLAVGLNFGAGQPDTPSPEKRRLKQISLAKRARSAGLAVLVMDLGKQPQTARAAYRLNREQGFVSLTVPATGFAAPLPPFPPRPFAENPRSVLSLADVRNFLYVPGAAQPGREDAFALALHRTNYDLLIVDVLHGRRPLGRRAVETLKYKNLGSRRLVLARLNIATAASYRYYWQEGWSKQPPPWLKEPVASDPDRFHVAYWQAPWQAIIAGDSRSYVYGLLDLGFDGVVLEGIDAFRHFEGSTGLDDPNA